MQPQYSYAPSHVPAPRMTQQYVPYPYAQAMFSPMFVRPAGQASDDPYPYRPSGFALLLSAVGTGLGAYHGYKRNDSIGWALWWGFLGGLFPVITTAVAFAQGFAKHER